MRKLQDGSVRSLDKPHEKAEICWSDHSCSNPTQSRMRWCVTPHIPRARFRRGQTFRFLHSSRGRLAGCRGICSSSSVCSPCGATSHSALSRCPSPDLLYLNTETRDLSRIECRRHAHLHVRFSECKRCCRLPIKRSDNVYDQTSSW